MNNRLVTDIDLQAYVDGRLPESRTAEVDAHLAGCPDDALRVRAYREQNLALKHLFAPVLDEPVPDRLIDAAIESTPPRDDYAPERSRGWLGSLAAGFALALVGGMLGWVARDHWQPAMLTAQAPRFAPSPASLPRQAAIAHAVFSPDIKRPVEIGAEQEDQLVTWLSKRLGSPIRPPKLGALGFDLIGGRLLPGSNGPVAQFMYHDGTGQRLTLYVAHETAGNSDTAFRFAEEGTVNVFYWIDGKFGYALSASIGKGDLARLATAVYDQLQPK